MTSEIERLLRNAHIFSRLVRRIFEEGYLNRATRGAVTFDQLNILKFLALPGTHFVKDVSIFLNASFAAASKAVTRLEKKGVVRTARCGHDRRAQQIEVTAKGHSLIRRYERLKASRVKGMLRGCDSGAISRGLEGGIAMLLKDRPMAGNPCLGCGAYYAKSCVARAHGQKCRCEPLSPSKASRRLHS